MFDADDPGTILNEFLIALFGPGIVLFVSLWLSFRFVFDGLLRSLGLPEIVPADGAGVLAAGYGRFLLLMVGTAVLLLPVLAVYHRFVRATLRSRGIV